MLNEHCNFDSNGFDECDARLSLEDLRTVDMGTYTMKLLSNSDRLYKLKNERAAALLETMARYRQQGLFCDVVLCVHDCLYPAHKIILASASTYFASMFSQRGHIEAETSRSIDLTQTVPCPRVMNIILEFLYTSQVTLNDQCVSNIALSVCIEVLPVLTCSIPLLLDELIEFCVLYLRDQLHPSNCIGIYMYGRQYECSSLIEAAQQYIFEHFEEVVRHEEFLSLSFHDLCSMIKDDKVKVKCESIIYNAAMQWVRHDSLNRRKEFCEVLPCIRMQYLDPSFLKCVMDDDYFAKPDMKTCRDYLQREYDKLTSHRYCSLPPHREPIKPLVIYCAGGYFNQSINTMECYFTETQRWKKCADLQVSRSGVGVVSLYMRVYVIGGRYNVRNENRDCRDVERYDPFVNKWTSIAPMIYPRNRLAVGTIDSFIYAIGGSCGQQLYSSVERYSPKTEKDGWVEVTPMHTARIGLAVCTHSRLLYAIGGFDGHKRLTEVESYNPDTNTWRNEKPLIFGRSGAAATTLAQFIFVVGGYASDKVTGPTQLNSVERYDTTTEQWSLITPINHPRSALSCVTLNNRIFALGGYDGNDFCDVVEIYYPERHEWVYGKPLTVKRSGHGSALTVEPTLDEDK